jgi:HEAT repeat protein
VRTLGAPSELTRLRVAENLERIGSASIGPLVESLTATTTSETAKEPHREPHDAVMAARVLGNLRAAQARDALLRAVHTSDDKNLRARAAQALGRIGDPDDIPTLLRAAGDEAWPVRAQAANALGMIGESSSVPTLKDLAADEAWWVRRNACSALANMGPEGEKALVELLKSDDRYARDQAAATLEARGFTRRAVGNLAKVGKRGERAHDTVTALVGAGVTRQLADLAEVLPEGEERHLLRELLGKVARSEPGVSGGGTNEVREEVGSGEQ